MALFFLFSLLSVRRSVGLFVGRTSRSAVPGPLPAATLSASSSFVSPPVVSEEKKRRILLLMSDTGGGHRASAQALSKAVEALSPGQWQCDIVDIWTDYAAWPYKNFVSYYAFMAKHPILWRAMWIWGKFPLTRYAQEIHCDLLNYARFAEFIEERLPETDAIVSVHPLCQTLPLKILRHAESDIPFVTVVTDLATAHPTWFHPGVDKCFVPSKSVYDIAKRCGLPDDKLSLHGLPLREPFWTREPRTKSDVRKDLGIAPDYPVALVVGGGDGVGRIAKLAKRIAFELDKPTSLVVVCGKNDDARTELENYEWPSHIRVHLHGFVKNIDEYMAASDCIVTKAGPGTIAEASTRALPCLISSYLPGQEAGNVEYVVRHKFGVFRRSPKSIAKTIRKWLDNEAIRQQMAQKAVQTAKPDATTNIANDIIDLISQHKNKQRQQE